MWGSDAMKTENEKMLKDAGADRKKQNRNLLPVIGVFAGIAVVAFVVLLIVLPSKSRTGEARAFEVVTAQNAPAAVRLKCPITAESDDTEKAEVPEQEEATPAPSKAPDTRKMVPVMEGETKEHAVYVFTKLSGFEESELVIKKEYSDKTDKGIVIRQDIPGGTRVDDGTKVTIVVSMGEEKISVPDVTGLSEVAAEEKIKESGLKVGNITTQYSSVVDAGYVISQTVRNGKKVKKGSKVGLVVSQGPEPVYEEPDSGGDSGGIDIWFD